MAKRSHCCEMRLFLQFSWSSLNFQAKNDLSNVGFLARKFEFLKVAGFANNVVKWDLFLVNFKHCDIYKIHLVIFQLLMVSKLFFFVYPWLRPYRLSKEFKHFLPWWKKVHGHFLIDVFLSAESGIKDFQLWIQGRKSQLRWEV